jgi:hypothetical protein
VKTNPSALLRMASAAVVALAVVAGCASNDKPPGPDNGATPVEPVVSDWPWADPVKKPPDRTPVKPADQPTGTKVNVPKDKPPMDKPPDERPPICIPGLPVTPDEQPATPTIPSLIAALEEDVKAGKADDAAKRQLALLCAIDGRYEQAEKLFSEIKPDGDEFAQAARAVVRNRLGLNEKAAQDLDALRKSWKTVHPLQITKAEFCSHVERFDVYKKFDKSEFIPGQAVILYFQIDNYLCKKLDDGRFYTSLRTDFKILDADGKAVEWKESERFRRDIDNFWSTYVTDFFFRIWIDRLPTALRPGKYTMHVQVKDNLSDKTAETKMEFQVR